jgi:hypothetical protein
MFKILVVALQKTLLLYSDQFVMCCQKITVFILELKFLNMFYEGNTKI